MNTVIPGSRSRRVVGPTARSARRRLVGSPAWYLNRRRKLLVKRPRLGRLAVGGPPNDWPTGRRVLIATNIGGYLSGTTVEATVAAALRARGHDVHVLLCDAQLPACPECTVERVGGARQVALDGPGRLCSGCFNAGRRTFEEVGATVHPISTLLDEADRAWARQLSTAVQSPDVGELVADGVRLGEHALAGALRCFARATIDSEPFATEVVRRYVEAGALTVRAVRRLLRTFSFDVAVFHHGIYVPQGLVADVCRVDGVRIVTWNLGYRARTFIFSHGDSFHRTLIDEPAEVWEQLGWDDAREAAILEHLANRRTGASDWITFHQHPDNSPEQVALRTGIDLARPCIGLLTNVMWDAQLHYPANAFPNMAEWIVDTIRWFAGRSALQLLIRVHPAELTGRPVSRQRVVDEIAQHFPVLPANVFIVGPDDPMGTFAAMELCDSVIIYGTKTGVELTAMGLPVIVAGEAWLRGKGISIDVSSVEEYHRVLERLPFGSRLDEATTRRARQYAYHFFFRRMIPLGFMEPTDSDPICRNVLDRAEALLPGNDAGLDVVIDGILLGTPFVFPADAGTIRASLDGMSDDGVGGGVNVEPYRMKRRHEPSTVREPERGAT
jgi:hypothetical protein